MDSHDKLFESGKLPSTIELSSLPKDVVDTIKIARIDLMTRVPFLGFLVMNTNFHFSNDVPIAAATTIGGNKIYFNPSASITKLKTREERAFTVAHELLHIYFFHIGRQVEQNYNAELWNVATDFVINGYLDNLNDQNIRIAKFMLLDHRFDGMSADQVYQLLLDENGGDANKAANKYGGFKDKSEEDNGQHPIDDVSSEKMGKGTENRLKSELGAAVAEGEKDTNNMGTGVGDLLKQFRSLIDSKIPWQVVFRDFILRKSKQRQTYNKPSFRSTRDIIFPSLTGDYVNVGYGIDTSGSMTQDDITEALSEMKGILESFDSWKLDLVSCDTQVNEIGCYESEFGDDFSNIDLKLIGGGGTELGCMVDYFQEGADENVDVITIVTDGYIPPINKNIDDIPVIILITSNGNNSSSVEEENPNATVIKM